MDPDVHLNPGYQFDQGDNKWSIGLTFDLPILNQNQGPIAEAKAHGANWPPPNFCNCRHRSSPRLTVPSRAGTWRRNN